MTRDEMIQFIEANLWGEAELQGLKFQYQQDDQTGNYQFHVVDLKTNQFVTYDDDLFPYQLAEYLLSFNQPIQLIQAL